MFREGRAAEALALKRQDGTARLIAGDYKQVVEGIAALWQERRAANAGDGNYSLSVSAPTNQDARAIGAAIREHRRAAGELGPDKLVLQACDQVGNVYDLPLAVGDRVRLFARTNAVCADKSRGILGNNGSVLEVREIDVAGVTLRNAHGREGRVAWDTLRDRQSGRIKLSYGDALTIDATQGLTSTEHIEAMPAGTQAVNAYKAYTSGSRHRRTTFLVTAEGAERREIAGRRPLGDTRPIREADVWLNMGRNLSRQPEQESALAFLQKAHAVRQAATATLQVGLQPAEQRAADGLVPTTLAPALQQRRIVGRVANMAERLGRWTEEQGVVLDKLRHLAPAAQEMVAQAFERLRPVIEKAAARIQQRPDRAAARKQTADTHAAREELLTLRMLVFDREQRAGTFYVDPKREKQWEEKARVEEAKQRESIGALANFQLQTSLQKEKSAEREHETQRKLSRPSRGISLGH